MSSMWERIQPTPWHRRSAIDMALMNFDSLMSNTLAALPLAETPMTHSFSDVEQQFFATIPEYPESTEEGESSKHTTSCYSSSSSSALDSHGRRVESTRLRYETTDGYLKALHQRAIGDKVMKTVWCRKNKDETGNFHSIAENTSPDEFEKLWKDTPFGKAEQEESAKIEPAGQSETEKAKSEEERETEHSTSKTSDKEQETSKKSDKKSGKK